MDLKCIVRFPTHEVTSYTRSMLNFKTQWAELQMEKREDGCFDGVLIDVSCAKGVVKFNHGIVLSIPLECICIQE